LELLTIDKALETYRHLHSKKPEFGMNVLATNFKAQKIVAVQDKGIKSKGIPVRFDFYTMILCLSGGSIRNVNQHKYIIKEKSLQLLPPGTIHNFVDTEENPQFHVLLFEKNFTDALDILNYHNQNFDNVELDSKLFYKVKDIYEEISLELNSKNENNFEYATSLLNQILIILKREKLKIKVDLNKSRADLISSSFLCLIESHFSTKKYVSDYSDIMGISSKHLSETVKEKLGKSALHFIHKRIIKEAKYLLIYSDKTIYSIAISLNFHDASQFTRFFKKNVDMTPKDYRLNNR
jgi:AraC family transcriptional activator of pobA